MTAMERAKLHLQAWFREDGPETLEDIAIKRIVEPFEREAREAERALMPCGHPRACLVQRQNWIESIPGVVASKPIQTTMFCLACELEAKAVANARSYECELGKTTAEKARSEGHAAGIAEEKARVLALEPQMTLAQIDLARKHLDFGLAWEEAVTAIRRAVESDS